MTSFSKEEKKRRRDEYEASRPVAEGITTLEEAPRLRAEYNKKNIKEKDKFLTQLYKKRRIRAARAASPSTKEEKEAYNARKTELRHARRAAITEEEEKEYLAKQAAGWRAWLNAMSPSEREAFQKRTNKRARARYAALSYEKKQRSPPRKKQQVNVRKLGTKWTKQEF